MGVLDLLLKLTNCIFVGSSSPNLAVHLHIRLKFECSVVFGRNLKVDIDELPKDAMKFTSGTLREVESLAAVCWEPVLPQLDNGTRVDRTGMPYVPNDVEDLDFQSTPLDPKSKPKPRKSKASKCDQSRNWSISRNWSVVAPHVFLKAKHPKRIKRWAIRGARDSMAGGGEGGCLKRGGFLGSEQMQVSTHNLHIAHNTSLFFFVLTLVSSAIKADSVLTQQWPRDMYSKVSFTNGWHAGKAVLHRGRAQWGHRRCMHYTLHAGGGACHNRKGSTPRKLWSCD